MSFLSRLFGSRDSVAYPSRFQDALAVPIIDETERELHQALHEFKLIFTGHQIVLKKVNATWLHPDALTIIQRALRAARDAIHHAPDLKTRFLSVVEQLRIPSGSEKYGKLQELIAGVHSYAFDREGKLVRIVDSTKGGFARNLNWDIGRLSTMEVKLQHNNVGLHSLDIPPGDKKKIRKLLDVSKRLPEKEEEIRRNGLESSKTLEEVSYRLIAYRTHLHTLAILYQQLGRLVADREVDGFLKRD